MLILLKSLRMGQTNFSFLLLCVGVFFFSGCKNSEKNLIPEALENEYSVSRELPQQFGDYWYAGKAEITSYQLTQERYGALRDGKAVNIYVTEDFLPEVQVKANNQQEGNIPVMKLNQTKKYVTGIYPYSVMTSVFQPTHVTSHAIKLSHSMQEWCGHVYIQLNNKDAFEITSHSYFQGEADQKLSLEKTWLEDELWTLIRINPEELPTGDVNIIPSMEFFRMSHQQIAPHQAYGKLMQGDSIATYTLTYQELKRGLMIYFSSTFPYEIERWEETHANGLKTTAQKLKRMRTAYWTQNAPNFEYLRDSLDL